LKEKRRQNKLAGKVPFGYTLSSNGVDLILNENEKKAIEIMKELKARGFSLRNIGTELDKLGYHAKNGGKWHATTINQIISAN